MSSLCAHGKVLKNSQIASEVPAIRKLLETLIYQMKTLAEKNELDHAFTIGVLKNRKIDGSEVIAEDEIDNSDEDQSENDNDDYADTNQGRQISNGGTKTSKKVRNKLPLVGTKRNRIACDDEDEGEDEDGDNEEEDQDQGNDKREEYEQASDDELFGIDEEPVINRAEDDEDSYGSIIDDEAEDCEDDNESYLGDKAGNLFDESDLEDSENDEENIPQRNSRGESIKSSTNRGKDKKKGGKRLKKLTDNKVRHEESLTY